MDEFVDVPGYPGYKANRLGEIKGMRGGILNQLIDDCGYSRVGTGTHEKRTTTKVHRLVAFTFIPNPDNLAEVDHINKNKTDNRVENLRWLSKADNGRLRDCVVNSKGYSTHSRSGWNVDYRSHDIRHRKWFKEEHDAQFYVALLKAIYPHTNL